jgi:hypothetical protein
VDRERRLHDLRAQDALDPAVYARIRRDLQVFIDLARQHGAALILTSHVFRSDEVGMLARQRYRAALSPAAVQEAHETLNQMMAELARLNGATFVDLAALIPATPATVVDASHFSNQGAQLMAEHLFPTVVQQVGRRDSTLPVATTPNAGAAILQTNQPSAPPPSAAPADAQLIRSNP